MRFTTMDLNIWFLCWSWFFFVSSEYQSHYVRWWFNGTVVFSDILRNNNDFHPISFHLFIDEDLPFRIRFILDINSWNPSHTSGSFKTIVQLFFRLLWKSTITHELITHFVQLWGGDRCMIDMRGIFEVSCLLINNKIPLNDEYFKNQFNELVDVTHLPDFIVSIEKL